MNFYFKTLFQLVFLSFFISCKYDKEKYQYISKSDMSYIATGGIVQGKITCPKTVNDVIVKIDDLFPPPKEGEPEMTIQGIKKFIDEQHITTITDLLNRLPKHFRNNFSLVEVTKGEGQSSLRYPRIVLFGSDGRFLMNISTKPDDPKYDLLDCAYLDDETGIWEFSQLDFQGAKPKLHVNPESCIRCHGDQPRPVWGTNLDWPGVFGDNEAIGLNGEALSIRHKNRMKEIIDGKTYSDRFDFLEWDTEQELNAGGKRRIANNVFGAELLISNMAMGSATGRGIFLRARKQNPEKYDKLKEAFLMSGYEHMVPGILSNKEKKAISKLIASYGGEGATVDDLLKVLGVNSKEAFSLGTLAKEETPRTDWSLGAGDLYDLMLLQLLDDMMKTDKELETIVSSVPNTPGIFGCDHLAKTMKDVVDFKMLHLFHLKGAARYEVNKVFYSQDAEDIKKRLFIPLYEKVMPYLRAKVLKV